MSSSDQRVSTLGEERANNPLLLFEDEEEFVKWFPGTFPGVPSYFSRMRPINQAGPRPRREVPLPPALTPSDFDFMRRQGLVLDVRPLPEYSEGHIPDSISNVFRDVYSTWLGWLVPHDTPLLFVTGDVPLQQVIDESLLVGQERFAGWLAGGMEAWTKNGLPVRAAKLVDAVQARKALLAGAVALDVREPREFEASHIEDAVPIPLGSLEGHLHRLPEDRPIVVYCGHGERSATGLSLLERAGFGSLLNLNGGIGAWAEAGYSVT